jgi:hypothetical protein
MPHGRPVDVAVESKNQALVVTVDENAVFVFKKLATEPKWDSRPSQTISGPNTSVSNPTAIAFS